MSDKRTIYAADLFCGGGGFTTAFLQAVTELDAAVELVAVNHWDIAISSHEANHPGVTHLCQSVDTVNPREVVPGGWLDILLASPECTHYSVARGGKPMNDQSRSCPWMILRWLSALNVRTVILENVKEFPSWGPLHECSCGSDEPENADPKKHQKGFRCHRPIEKLKGKFFRMFVRNLKCLGYKVDWKVLNSADYGDATTRQRFFLQARRDKKPIIWPEPTHYAPEHVHRLKTQTSLFTRSVRPWRPAAEIIDWSVPGHSIYMSPAEARGRKLRIQRPLAENTLNRIYYGLRKFALVPFLLPNEGFYRGNTPRSLTEPVPTITQRGAGGIVEPFLVPNFGERAGQPPRCHSLREPLPTITGHGAGGLVEPFLVVLRNHGAAQSLDGPAPAICANGQHLGLAQGYLVGAGGPAGKGRARGVDEPLGTILAENHTALVRPCLLPHQHGSSGRDNVRGVDEPLPTVTGTSADMFLVNPFLAAMEHVSGASGRCYGADRPMPSITAKGDWALLNPYLAQYHGGEGGERRVQDLADPLRTVDTSNRYGLIEPHLIAYYGNGHAHSVGAPLPTITTRDRFALVHPQFREHVEGEIIGYLDILFRMLMPRELAAAMSFPTTYSFAGNQEDQIKQIGNAVSIRKAKALCLAVLGPQEALS